VYSKIADRLSLSSAGTFYSEALEMTGANAVQVDFTVMAWGGTGSLVLNIQESNDCANWSDALTTSSAGSSTLSSVGYQTFRVLNVGGQMVRVRYVLASASSVVVSAGVNTSLM